jgi:hypothetical protein
MTITRNQAVEIHAKALCAGHSRRWATRRATAEALRCQAKGDLEGCEVWLQVCDAVRRQAPKPEGGTIH